MPYKTKEDRNTNARKRYKSNPEFKIRTNVRNKIWQKNHRDKVNAYARKWRLLNPEKVRLKNRKSALKRKSGITMEIYDTAFELQNGACRICNVIGEKLLSDHDHSSGRFRGLLCARCNFGLGNFRDDISVMSSAIKYINENKDVEAS